MEIFRMKKARLYYMLLFALIISSKSMAQSVLPTSDFNLDSVQIRISRQIDTYPQEKIHVQTDKSYYISGEKIWFRAFLMNAFTNMQDTTSLYIYGELVDPLGQMISRVRIKTNNEAYAGHFQLDEELPAGMYNLRFYTKYLENLGEDYFYTKSINVGTPSTMSYKAEISTSYKNSKKADLKITFRDVITGEKVKPTKIVVAQNLEQYGMRRSGNLATTIKTNDENIASYSIDMSKNPIKYLFLEYIVDGNVCSEFVFIPDTDSDFHVDFFAEGGHLISDAVNSISFKALGNDGFATDITGVIYSDAGDTIIHIASVYKGMGVFPLQGERGKHYYAICKNKRGDSKRFELPECVSEGYTLSVKSVNDNVYCSVLSANEPPQDFTLLMHARGHILYMEPWNPTEATILLSKEELPVGIIQCVLLNGKGQPVSERLFLNFDQKMVPSIEVANNKKKYLKRELVVSDLNVVDRDGDPVNGSFSVSVTDDRDVKIDSTQNMISTLLLSSELKGYIEDPAFYFKGTRQASYATDLLMQTQGWRRYNLENVLAGKIESPTIPLEYTFSISGNVKGGLLMSKNSKDAIVHLFDVKHGNSMTAETDDQGNFSFVSMLPDSLDFVVFAATKKGGTRLFLELNKETFPTMKENQIFPKIQTPQFYDYLKKADMKYTLENGMRMIHLEGVEVVAEKKNKGKKSFFSSAFNTSVNIEDMERMGARTLKNVLMRVAGVKVEGDNVYIRANQSPAAIYVDDVPGREDILQYDPDINEIENIEVVKDGGVVVFGSRGSNGVVLITTKRGEIIGAKDQKFNMAKLDNLGYQSYAEFYSPKYETKFEKTSEKPDLRSTLYWSPNIKVVDGKAKIEFYTADEPSTYSIFIDGVTEYGEPLHVIEKIGAEQE